MSSSDLAAIGNITDNKDGETEEKDYMSPPVVWYWNEKYIPVVVADDAEILNRVDAQLAFSVYKLIANKPQLHIEKNVTVKDPVTGTSKFHQEYKHYTYSPAIFTVAQNRVGWAITEDLNQDISLTPVEPTFEITIPKIPWKLLKRVDDFLRAVHDKMRSEAIVILTFDPTKDDSSGWGVVCPTQSNNAAHCAYEWDSVIEHKPDHVEIVGSIHSHPNMSAFASGTDHSDQQGFDGIHITYGWYGNGPTEFHIEYQMQGKNWILNTNQIFEDFPRSEPDEEVRAWMERVTEAPMQGKALPQSKTGKSSTQPTGQYSADTTSAYSYDLKPSPQIYNDPHSLAIQSNAYTAPAGCDSIDLDRFMILAYLKVNEHGDVTDTECPICGAEITKLIQAARRCTTCYNYHILPNEDLTDLIKLRETLCLDVNPLKQAYPYIKGIASWARIGNASSEIKFLVEDIDRKDQILPLA